MSTKTFDTSTHEEPINIKTLSDPEKKELVEEDAVSVSTSTAMTVTSGTLSGATKSLHINTKGIPILRLPLPPSELQISIHDSDGSVAYVSTRERRSSGNCILSDAQGKPLIGTTYFFGPGRHPLMTIFADDKKYMEVKTTSRWTSRSHTFVLPNGRALEWTYKREKGFGGPDKKGTALVLLSEGKPVALLIRNDDTRTSGSKSCSAGNGGELIIGEEVGLDGLSQELVVASCLLMLKREVDRRRAVQMMMISAAASGGS